MKLEKVLLIKLVNDYFRPYFKISGLVFHGTALESG